MCVCVCVCVCVVCVCVSNRKQSKRCDQCIVITIWVRNLWNYICIISHFVKINQMKIPVILHYFPNSKGTNYVGIKIDDFSSYYQFYDVV